MLLLYLRKCGASLAADLMHSAAAVHAVGPHAGISLHPPQGLRGAPPVPQSPRGFRVRLDPKRPEGAFGGGAELGEPAAVVLPTESGGRGVQSAGARVLLPAGGAAELHAAAAAAGGHAGAELAVPSLRRRAERGVMGSIEETRARLERRKRRRRRSRTRSIARSARGVCSAERKWSCRTCVCCADGRIVRRTEEAASAR